MPKSRDFNRSFDVKHVFLPQFILKLQAKTSKIDILIFCNFVKKKTRQNDVCLFQFPSKSHQNLSLKNLQGLPLGFDTN